MTNHDQLMQRIVKDSSIFDQISRYKVISNDLLAKRVKVLFRLSISEMPEDQRYNKLKRDGKKLKNAVLMLACSVESSCLGILYILQD